MNSIPDDALVLLRCPLTRQPLVKASSELLERLNGMIQRRELKNRLGAIVADRLDEALVGTTGEWLYAVRAGMVCLLSDEAISLDRSDLEER